MAAKRAAVHVAVGTASTSLSKWVLVWLFAQSSGGPEAVGVYSFILAFATPLFVVCQLGLRTIFLSSATRWPWRTYFWLRILGNAVGGIAVLTFVAVSPGVPVDLGLAILLLKLCDSTLDIQMARIQYGNRMRLLGIVSTTSGACTMVCAALVVWLTRSATGGVIAAGIVSAGASVWAWWAGRATQYDPDGSGPGTRQILAASAPVTASQFLATFLFQLPVLALAWTADTHVIGTFAAAAYLLTAAGLTGSTLQTILITPLRRRREQDGVGAVSSEATRIALRTLAIGAVVGLVVVVAGSPALTFVYGPGFTMAHLPLALLALAAIATVGAFVMSVALTVLNRYATVTSAMALSCVASAVIGITFSLLEVEPLVTATAMSATGATFRLVLLYGATRRAARQRP